MPQAVPCRLSMSVTGPPLGALTGARVCSAPWDAREAAYKARPGSLAGWGCPLLGQDKVILPLPLAREALPTQVAPRPGNRL